MKDWAAVLGEADDGNLDLDMKSGLENTAALGLNAHVRCAPCTLLLGTWCSAVRSAVCSHHLMARFSSNSF